MHLYNLRKGEGKHHQWSIYFSYIENYLIGNDELRRSSALFLLKLKEHRRLSQVAIDDVVEGTNALFYRLCDHLRAKVKAELDKSEQVQGWQLDNLFDDVVKPFNGIETCYLQEKYYQNALGLIVSSR